MATHVRMAAAKSVGKTGSKAAKKSAAGTAKKAVKKAVKKAAMKVAKAPAGKAAAKKAVRKAATKTTTARKTVAAKSSPRKAAVGKTTARKTATKKAAPRRTAGTASTAQTAKRTTARKALRKATGKPRRITPQQALEQTRQLLDAKHEHDRQPQPWQQLDENAPHAGGAGFTPQEARHEANELHLAESRVKAIQGSAGVQGRHNQGKRDSR